MRALFILGFFISSLAYSQDGTSVSQTPLAPVTTEKSYKLGATVKTINFRYTEANMRDEGRLTGVDLYGDFKLSERINFLGALELVGGKTKYTGELQNGTPFIDDNQNFQIYDLKALFDFKTQMTTSVDSSFYFGLGHRLTTDKDDATKADYKREITYNYIEGGYKLEIPYASSRHLSQVKLGFLYLTSGGAKTYLSNVDSRLPDVVNKFNTGEGYAVSFDHEYKMERVSLIAGLDYKIWNIADSQRAKLDSRTTVIEPQNRTELFGVRVGVVF